VPPRRALVLAALLGLILPLLGLHAAQAVGTGVPLIVTPANGEFYHVDEVPDLHLDLSDAPYGDYLVELTDIPDHVLFSADVEHSEAVDPDAFYELPELGLAEYTVTVYVTADAVLATATFGTYDLGEPPVPFCELVVPSKVVAVSPTTAVYPKFVGCFDRIALWQVTRRTAGGVVSLAFLGIKDGVSRGAWKYKDSLPTGRYGLRPTGENQNTTSTVVKFGSRISLASSRTGTRVPLSGVASRYLPAVDGFRAWANRPVAISYKDCLSCPWKFLAMDSTDSAGRWGLTVISGQVRYYRAAVGETATAWGRTSVPVRR